MERHDTHVVSESLSPILIGSVVLVIMFREESFPEGWKFTIWHDTMGAYCVVLPAHVFTESDFGPESDVALWARKRFLRGVLGSDVIRTMTETVEYFIASWMHALQNLRVRFHVETEWGSLGDPLPTDFARKLRFVVNESMISQSYCSCTNFLTLQTTKFFFLVVFWPLTIRFVCTAFLVSSHTLCGCINLATKLTGETFINPTLGVVSDVPQKVMLREGFVVAVVTAIRRVEFLEGVSLDLWKRIQVSRSIMQFFVWVYYMFQIFVALHSHRAELAFSSSFGDCRLNSLLGFRFNFWLDVVGSRDRCQWFSVLVHKIW